MKTVEEFIKQMITVDFMEDTGVYGHYPFQMFVETKDGGLEVNALAVNDVRICYKRAQEYIGQNASKIFMSIDFPKGGDIANDFVAVFSIENSNVSVVALPYNVMTGEVYNTITTSNFLNVIKSQFNDLVMPQFRSN